MTAIDVTARRTAAPARIPSVRAIVRSLAWPSRRPRRRDTAEELLVQLLPHLAGTATPDGTWPSGPRILDARGR